MTTGSDGTVAWRALLAEAELRLSSSGVDDPRLDARRIVEECAGLDGAELAVALDEPVTVRQMAAFDGRLARRLAGEPLQYVVGRWGFRTLDLMVDRRVLIPRPETEVVAGLAIDALRRRIEQDIAGSRDLPTIAVDLGCGSGAIGLSLAAEVPGTEVWLTDRSSDAVAVARANLAGLGARGGGVRLAEGSWFDALPGELAGSVAVVVSNPPYVADDEELPAVVADWEPGPALFAGDDGAEHLRHLVVASPSWLRNDGALVLEMAPHQVDAVASLAAEHFDDVTTHDDLAGRARAVAASGPRRR